MPSQTIIEAVREGRILVSDAAWGTSLQKRGLKPGECPELLNLTAPDTVLAVARSFVEAGADMIQTNSFGGSRFKLEQYDLADKTVAINRAAASLSRQAAGEDHWVIASLGPTGRMLLMGDTTPDELYEAFAEQAQALAQGGADGICVETMSAVDEAALAIRAAREKTACEVIATFTFEQTQSGDYRTMMGVSPTQAAEAATDAGAMIIGTNCGNGLRGMAAIVSEMRRAAAEAVLLVHANAGLPANVNGEQVFPESPDDMAAAVQDIVEAGAAVIGGCCGTTPEHITAIKREVGRLESGKDGS